MEKRFKILSKVRIFFDPATIFGKYLHKIYKKQAARPSIRADGSRKW